MDQSILSSLLPEIWRKIAKHLDLHDIHHLVVAEGQHFRQIISPEDEYEIRMRRKDFHILDDETSFLIENNYWEISNLISRKKLLIGEITSLEYQDRVRQRKIIETLLQLMAKEFCEEGRDKTPFTLCVRLSLWDVSISLPKSSEYSHCLVKLSNHIEVSVMLVDGERVPPNGYWIENQLEPLIVDLHTDPDGKCETGVIIQVLQSGRFASRLREKVRTIHNRSLHHQAFQNYRKKGYVEAIDSILGHKPDWIEVDIWRVFPPNIVIAEGEESELFCCKLTGGCPLVKGKFKQHLYKESFRDG